MKLHIFIKTQAHFLNKLTAMDGSCFLGSMTKLLLGIFLLTFIHTISPSLAITNITTDQSALLSLKAHITYDPLNILASNWSTSTSICNWVGVTCGFRHQRVTVLNFSSFGLTGTIPPHLGNLSFLTELHFMSNNLHGFLPIELTRLRRLKFINFGSNEFVGEIPLLFGSFSKLQVLALYGNQFSGSIPKEIGNATMLNILEVYENKLTGSIPKEIGNATTLNILRVYDNKLTGTIPSILFNMSHLKILSLGDNNFDSGELPDKICRNLPNLELLYMRNSNLGGRIPSQLSECGKLLSFALSFNSFVGSIPQTVGSLTNLEVLYLDHNKLTGGIPKEIGNATMLNALVVSDNNLTGSIPKEIGNAKMLNCLYVHENKLTGIIPSVIFNMSHLKILSLGDNNFDSGDLPDKICQNLPNLELLYMGNSNLGERIPSQLSQCGKLRSLLLSFNNFVGSIPRTVGNMTNLEELYLNHNKLTGTIPDEIGNLYNLKEFSVNYNHLNGSIPSKLFNTSSQLTMLLVAENSIYGYLTSAFGTLRNLQKLLLYSNNFTSDDFLIKGFFTSLASCKDLKALQLDNNPLNLKLPRSIGGISSSLEKVSFSACKLRGTIPVEIGNLSGLIALWLDANELIGSIPITIRKLQKLQYLDLNKNKLKGFIPSGICQLKSLDGLYLASNMLSGPLPSCFKELTSLRYLYLYSNELTSSIPTELWSLIYILKLDMSSNNFSGPLSEDVGKLKVVIDFDMSDNQLSGNIPSSIGALQDLVTLSLAHNSFEGSIPQTLGELISVESMDLSDNNLTGVIPKLLEKALHLKYLNLSFNKLYGEIPSGGHFLDFSAQSFMGNEALCGPPKLQVPLCKFKRGEGARRILLVLKCIVPIIASTLLVLTLLLIWKRCKKSSAKHASEENLLPLVERRRVSYYELLRVTNGFSETNLLGSGSFGLVYHGKLNDGMDVAVKVFNSRIEGGFQSFDIECNVLCNLRHRNLIKVISVCSNIDFKAVVLQYMPFGSLENWLHSNNHSLSLLQRLNIMINVASAVEYLHYGYSESIVHCDIKPTNVLLDNDMVAYVADFGVAKFLSGSDVITQTMTLATIGYMAPEYGLEGFVSTRGDIYSYGILLMETFTGKRPIDEMFVGELSLKKWVQDAFSHYDVMDVVDTRLLKGDNVLVVKMCVSSIFKLALCCATEVPIERKNMKEISIELNKVKSKYLLEI